MGALHTRLQNLQKMHNSLTFPNKEMRVTSFGLLNLNGGCMSPIVNHCQLQ